MPNARSLHAPRLRAICLILSDGQWHTGWEITRHRDVRATDTSMLRELRTLGFDLECRRTGDRAEYRFSAADLERWIAHERGRLEDLRARLEAAADRHQGAAA